MDNLGKDRQSFFVVRKPDNAILVFCSFSILTFLGIFIVSGLLTDNSWSCSLLLAYSQITRISALSLLIVLSIEGVDIMKSRYEEAKGRTQKRIDQARKEGYNKGFKDGKKSAPPKPRPAKGNSVKPKSSSVKPKSVKPKGKSK